MLRENGDKLPACMMRWPTAMMITSVRTTT